MRSLFVSTGRPAFCSAALVAATAGALARARSTPDFLRWAIEGCRSRSYRGGAKAVVKMNPGSMRSDRIHDSISGGDVASERPKGLGKCSFDDVDARP